MRLVDVLHGLDGTDLRATTSGAVPETVDITGITYDSAQVQPGWLFVAVPGRKTDGHQFIPDALARGAIAIVGDRDAAALDLPYIVSYVQVSDPRRALGLLACELAGQPSRHMAVVGVTGTDGKTTTTELIAALLDEAGHSSGSTSTVDFKIGGRRIENETRFTNLEAPELQGLLQQMVKEGVDYAVIEST